MSRWGVVCARRMCAHGHFTFGRTVKKLLDDGGWVVCVLMTLLTDALLYGLLGCCTGAQGRCPAICATQRRCTQRVRDRTHLAYTHEMCAK